MIDKVKLDAMFYDWLCTCPHTIAAFEEEMGEVTFDEWEYLFEQYKRVCPELL